MSAWRYLATCIVFLTCIGLIIIWQATQTLSLFLFDNSVEANRFYRVPPGALVDQVVSVLGEPEERVYFHGVRMSDQRAYDELLIYDRVEGEAHIYVREGRVVFTALVSISPLPLASLQERSVGRIFVLVIFLILLLILVSMGRSGKTVDHRPLTWATLAGLFAVYHAVQPYYGLSRWSWLFSACVTALIVLLWFLALAGMIGGYSALLDRDKVTPPPDGEL